MAPSLRLWFVIEQQEAALSCVTTRQNVLVNDNFVRLLEVTCHEHPCLEVQYGGIGGFIAKKPPKRVDPMKVIQV